MRVFILADCVQMQGLNDTSLNWQSEEKAFDNADIEGVYYLYILQVNALLSTKQSVNILLRKIQILTK